MFHAPLLFQVNHIIAVCGELLSTGDGIKGVDKQMLQAKQNIEKVASSVKNAAKTLATIGAGVGAAGTAVFAFANKVSSTGDNIDKMSQKLGISAEGYQEWSHILEHSGASIDSLQPSMKTLAVAAETGSDTLFYDLQSTRAALPRR